MKTNKRQDILDAYAQAIQEFGIGSASVGKIAAKLDIPPSLIFHYFKNKDEMTVELAQNVFRACTQSYFVLERTFENDEKEFVEFIDHVFHIHSRREDQVDSNVYYTFVHQTTFNTAIKDLLLSFMWELTDKFAEYLIYYTQKGIINAKEPYFLAQKLLCLVDGLSYSWMVMERETYFMFARKLMEDFLQELSFQGDLNRYIKPVEMEVQG